MRNWMWVLAIGCGGDGSDDKTDGSTDVADTDTDTDADADTDTDTDTDTDADADSDTDTDPLDGCSADPDVVSFSVAAGSISAAVELSVTLDAPAPVVARCVLDLDPAQVFFAESTDAVEDHTLRLMGLVPNLAYTCSAAPDCAGRTQPPAVAPYVAAAPPNNIRRVSIDKDPVLGMSGTWTMASFNASAFAGQMYILVWGPEGRVRWWYALPGGLSLDIEALYDVDRDEVVWGGGYSPEGRVRIVDMWDGETYAFSPPGWQQTRFHHDAKRLADGRLITLEVRENQSGNDTWDGFGIRVHDDATGTIDVDIDSQRYVDEGRLRTANSFFDTDPYHANWMDLIDTPSGEKLYVSLCFDQTIMALDPSSGDVLWHLGANKGWTVVDDAGAPLDEGLLPQCQHGVQVLGDDHLLVYDNGQNRSFSSAQEWKIDGPSQTATLLWSWTESGWNEDFLGDIDLLDDDRVLITQATFVGPSEIVEVDRATGGVASRITLDQGGYTYRSERYDACDLFTDATQCDVLGTRHAEVEGLLTP